MAYHRLTYSPAARLFVLMVLVLVNVGKGLQAQEAIMEKIIQISGKVVTEENERMVFVPYAVVAIKGTNRGTLTDFSGFFSIVVRTSETLVFSVLGFKDAFYEIPDDLTAERYTVFQILTRDTILLPEAVIYPWPDPDFFNQEFLAMDVHDDLEDIAKENLSEKAMAELREYLPSDGPEHTQFYLRQQSQSYYSEGQIKPQNIFNAFAWKQFIEAWKRGDFKKKDKK
ncbi:MAG: carboxypeptidase-like regulatory domain-containing protein [Saprospiraceae bacterium]|nr:carboxypeptidase-like regulatory domain-containing protein [Saprospiraceae bacterium]